MNNIQNIKDFQNTIVNQTKYLADTAMNFGNNPVKYNPFMSMTFSWQVAQLNKRMIQWITLPLDVSAVYWNTWSSVYSPEGKE